MIVGSNTGNIVIAFRGTSKTKVRPRPSAYILHPEQPDRPPRDPELAELADELLDGCVLAILPVVHSQVTVVGLLPALPTATRARTRTHAIGLIRLLAPCCAFAHTLAGNLQDFLIDINFPKVRECKEIAGPGCSGPRWSGWR